jgi:hypothetical protein
MVPRVIITYKRGTLPVRFRINKSIRAARAFRKFRERVWVNSEEQ